MIRTRMAAVAVGVVEGGSEGGEMVHIMIDTSTLSSHQTGG